ncbi:hypothetical protein [Pseudomonas aeruginosa]|uniref:hypothetical protein n=1 Tax=Pseudomonas aeruginosa TaxID=287 RepID=UPI00232DC941|nr:hypothetical protein [Pseudomonas aeruginosa]
MRLHKRSLVWGLALSGLAVVLAAAWWASQASREPALWSELRVPPAFAIPRDFDLGEYRLSWGGKSLALSVAGSARPPLWESEGGFLGAGRESAGRLQLRCQEQSLESFQLIGRRLSLKGHLRCADGRLSAYELSFEPRQGGVEVRVALADSELNRVALSWRRGAGERLSGIVDDQAEGRSWGLPGGVAGYWSSAGNAFLGYSTAAQSLDLREPGRVQWRAATESARAWLFAAGNREQWQLRSARLETETRR